MSVVDVRDWPDPHAGLWADLELLFQAARVSPILRDAVTRVRGKVEAVMEANGRLRLECDEASNKLRTAEKALTVMRLAHERAERLEAELKGWRGEGLS